MRYPISNVDLLVNPALTNSLVEGHDRDSILLGDGVVIARASSFEHMQRRLATAYTPSDLITAVVRAAQLIGNSDEECVVLHNTLQLKFFHSMTLETPITKVVISHRQRIDHGHDDVGELTFEFGCINLREHPDVPVLRPALEASLMYPLTDRQPPLEELVAAIDKLIAVNVTGRDDAGPDDFYCEKIASDGLPVSGNDHYEFATAKMESVMSPHGGLIAITNDQLDITLRDSDGNRVRDSYMLRAVPETPPHMLKYK